MKCRQCSTKAIIHMPEHRLALCQACYPAWFLNYTERTIKKFRMFTRADRILVAVSGGKDSLALWHALIELGYQADGFYIDLGIDENIGYSQKSKAACVRFAQRLNRPLHTVAVADEVGASVPAIKHLTRRVACSGCGLVKRYLMNRTSLEAGYDVIATGHNLDDEVALLFGNTLRWDQPYLARQYPVLDERDGLKKKVKPFIYFTEKQTTVYALLNQIAYVRDECPFARGATSLYHKDIINKLEHDRPGTKRQFLDGFFKAREKFVNTEPEPLIPCPHCGQPTTVGVCAYCRLVETVRRRQAPLSVR